MWRNLFLNDSVGRELIFPCPWNNYRASQNAIDGYYSQEDMKGRYKSLKIVKPKCQRGGVFLGTMGQRFPWLTPWSQWNSARRQQAHIFVSRELPGSMLLFSCRLQGGLPALWQDWRCQDHPQPGWRYHPGTGAEPNKCRGQQNSGEPQQRG